MKVIFCGSRDWRDYGIIQRTVRKVGALGGSGLLIIHGGARGADSMTEQAAKEMGIPVQAELADWVGKGRSAGPERNRRMLELKPDSVYAFKDNFDQTLTTGGTEHMVKIALEAGVTVHLYDRGRWQTLTHAACPMCLTGGDCSWCDNSRRA